MARSISEWIGKSDDHRAPARVRQRVFDSARGICHLCQLQIQTGQKWDLDHVIALINGGENRESNLKPAHLKCHVAKTAKDVAEKAKVAAIRGKHIGAIRPKQTIKSAASQAPQKTNVQKQSLPPRRLFRGFTNANK